MTSPNPSGEGVARAMQMALDESGFTAEEVGHLNAHGTSTPLNDKTEAAALRIVVGEERGREIPVISVKGVTGHMLGGAGAGRGHRLRAVGCQRLRAAHGRLPQPRPRGAGARADRGAHQLPAEGGAVQLHRLRRPQRNAGHLALPRRVTLSFRTSARGSEPAGFSRLRPACTVWAGARAPVPKRSCPVGDSGFAGGFV